MKRKKDVARTLDSFATGPEDERLVGGIDFFGETA
jgi:hypothetical protein